ncbi:hypothetical protein Tco_1262940 [Tanacetum coccineum]
MASGHGRLKEDLESSTWRRRQDFKATLSRLNPARPMSGKEVNTARPKAIVDDVKGNNVNAVKALACWVWKPKTKVLDHGNPQMDLQDQGVIDSGCSRHMIRNMSYLTNYKEIDEGYVAFGGTIKRREFKGKDSVNTLAVVQNSVFSIYSSNKNPLKFSGSLRQIDGKADDGFLLDIFE